MAPFLTLGIGMVLAGATASSDKTTTCRFAPQKQTSTSASVVDYEVVNKLGENFYKLYGFLAFKSGWNGYSGKPFSRKTIDRTMSILKNLNVQPKMFPTGRGTVQLEYHIDEDNLVEMEVSATEISALWVVKGVETEEIINNESDAIRNLNDFIN